jgi:hypothetical protein
MLIILNLMKTNSNTLLGNYYVKIKQKWRISTALLVK